MNHDYGSIEGYLVRRCCRHMFVMEDDLDRYSIACLSRASDALVENVAIGRRIAVEGSLHYTADGRIALIEADGLTVIPKECELLPVETALGILHADS